MKVVQKYPGARVTHEFQEMTPEKRPQDHQRRDGRGLRYETLEHGGAEPDVMPQAIRVIDLDDRNCIFVPAEQPAPEQRAQDDLMDGSDLKFEPFTFGGEYDDNMPKWIRLTDRKGRSCVYVPITENGRVVDSKRFILERLPEPTKQKAAARGQIEAMADVR
ncbi:MAG: hypothetical protein JO162_05145 [Alphaproteobacteria bacterium]|nr:hypothetical protein [Alphaproteobacteria bacterium]